MHQRRLDPYVLLVELLGGVARAADKSGARAGSGLFGIGGEVRVPGVSRLLGVGLDVDGTGPGSHRMVRGVCLLTSLTSCRLSCV